MALSFLTNPQQMIFVDTVSGTLTSAGSLLPNHDYYVFFTIQNDGNNAEFNVVISLTHSPFGIGLPGGTNLMTPNPIIIPMVPPAAFGVNGQALASFTYSTPPGGHACIVARIVSNGICLNQNTTVIGVPSGASSITSFMVYGAMSSNVRLQLTETIDTLGGIINVPPGPSWTPRMIAPPGFGPNVPTASPLILTGLASTGFYSVGLQVTIPAGATDAHIFNIKGYDNVTNAYLGEVDIRLEPASIPVVACNPFIFGGYQSADIILIDPLTGTEVPLGGAPGGAWDTLLRANTNYGFAANIHNASPTPAVNTVVRFWQFPGGLASIGTLVDVKTVTIQANNSLVVHSDHPFHSPPLNHHSCAVVSIYNAMASTCNIDAVTAVQVPNPGGPGHIGCSAWRNTDSMWVYIGLPWHFNLDIDSYEILSPDPGGPVEINMIAQHVPFDWMKNPKYLETDALLKAADIHANKPMFLLPDLRKTFKNIDLNMKVKMQEGGKIEYNKEKSAYSISLFKGCKTEFEIAGDIPKNAKKGDIILVNVTALYPKSKRAAAKTIEYLQVLHITDKHQ